MSDDQSSKVRLCGMAPARGPKMTMWNNMSGGIWFTEGDELPPADLGPWTRHVAASTPGGETVEHPAHYNRHPSGVECLTIVRHMNFNLGNAMKYLWRVDEKGDPIENLRKAAFCINDEIKRREASND